MNDDSDPATSKYRILNNDPRYRHGYFGGRDVRVTLLDEVVRSLTEGTLIALTVTSLTADDSDSPDERIELTHLRVNGIQNTSYTKNKEGAVPETVTFMARAVHGEYKGTTVEVQYRINFPGHENSLSLRFPGAAANIEI